jgi:hypothetical protein
MPLLQELSSNLKWMSSKSLLKIPCFYYRNPPLRRVWQDFPITDLAHFHSICVIIWDKGGLSQWLRRSQGEHRAGWGGWGWRRGGAVRRAESGDTVALTQRRDSDIHYTLPRPVKCRLLHYRRYINSRRKKIKHFYVKFKRPVST